MTDIVVSSNVTLDGIIEDPLGTTDSPAGGWGTQISDADRAEWAEAGLREAQDAQALLLGRGSYEFLAERFPARTDPWAARLNGLPKYVVSSTLTRAEWDGSTILRGNVVDEVVALKQAVTGTILIYASSQLLPSLIAADLVDEVRMIIYPVVVGSGRGLFEGFSARTLFRLAETQTIGGNLAKLTYRLDAGRPGDDRVREATHG